MLKKDVIEIVESLQEMGYQTCQTLWDNPELGGHENKSANLFRDMLRSEGFVIVNEENLEHAFYAEYGSGSPVIAILGEYDALPGLSQKVGTSKEPVVEGGAGHGCGHNLLGTAAALGAIAIKRFLESGNMSGTIRFYGCPEEELLSGKVKMAYHKMFDGCDVALSWHPMSLNAAYDKAFIANASARFFFKGVTSHAGFAPERGRSALDAVELMNVGSNYLREHVTPKARIHYAVDSGGFAPNIVPDRASAWYFVRAPKISQVREILERIKKIAQGAALMTETEVDIKVECGCCELKEHRLFADITHDNLVEIGSPTYTEEELEFAQALQDSVAPDIVKNEQEQLQQSDSPMFSGVGERDLWKAFEVSGSSDSGDVSYIMPTCFFTSVCWPIGVSPHTWQATAANGSTLGKKGAMHAAKVFAGIAYDLLTKPDLVSRLKKEFDERKTEEYKPMYNE
ncbi:MAG: amidohydrolase [Peptostreptococcaceae bacterium]|nr:amidohydrolase [Peptostreptococcaceae bacterium]